MVQFSYNQTERSQCSNASYVLAYAAHSTASGHAGNKVFALSTASGHAGNKAFALSHAGNKAFAHSFIAMNNLTLIRSQTGI